MATDGRTSQLRVISCRRCSSSTPLMVLALSARGAARRAHLGRRTGWAPRLLSECGETRSRVSNPVCRLRPPAPSHRCQTSVRWCSTSDVHAWLTGQVPLWATVSIVMALWIGLSPQFTTSVAVIQPPASECLGTASITTWATHPALSTIGRISWGSDAHTGGGDQPFLMWIWMATSI
jgi:hypothetical protein